MPTYKVIEDDFMSYDYELHSYKPTISFIEDSLGISLVDMLNTSQNNNPDRIPEFFVEQLSDTLYTFLLSYAQKEEITQLYLTNINYRPYIKRAFSILAQAWVVNRYNPSMVFDSNIKELVPEFLKTFCETHELCARQTIVIPNVQKYEYGVDF